MISSLGIAELRLLLKYPYYPEERDLSLAIVGSSVIHAACHHEHPAKLLVSGLESMFLGILILIDGMLTHREFSRLLARNIKGRSVHEF